MTKILMNLCELSQTIKFLIFFNLIFGVSFLINADVQAKQSQKIFTTVSTGTQFINSAFSHKTNKEAEKAALKASVERAVSAIITPEEFSSNFVSLYENVLSNPSKYILNYSVIAELKTATKYVAAVKVRIDLELLKENLKEDGVIKSDSAKPSILLLISEQGEADILPKYWWGENPQLYEFLVANEIIRLLTMEEFIVVGGNADEMEIKQQGIVFNSIYDLSAAMELGLKQKADIVIFGKVKSFEALNRMGAEKIYEADIILDIFNVSTQKKIAAFELKGTANNINDVEGNRNALIKLGELAAEEIAVRATKYWEENILKKQQIIETRIEGEDYLSNFVTLRKTLNDIPSVKSVQIKELGTGQAIVSILFKGNAEQLAQILLLKTFDFFGLEIYNVKDKSLTIKFISKQ